MFALLFLRGVVYFSPTCDEYIFHDQNEYFLTLGYDRWMHKYETELKPRVDLFDF
jgi:hypothetical protein